MKGTDFSDREGENFNRAKFSESLLRRKYIIPFLLACVICVQPSPAYSIIGTHTNILCTEWLSDVQAIGVMFFHNVNFVMTSASSVVERKGRKVLLSVGQCGYYRSLICTAVLFADEACA